METCRSREEHGTRVGYTRVSTVAQTLDQQNALTAAGVTKVFSDVMSGARDDRPGLAALMAYVRAGDAVVVWKLEAGPQHAAHPADRQGVDRPGRDAGFHYGRHRLVHPRRSHDNRHSRGHWPSTSVNS